MVARERVPVSTWPEQQAPAALDAAAGAGWRIISGSHERSEWHDQPSHEREAPAVQGVAAGGWPVNT